MTETDRTDKLLISEHVPGDTTEETIELLLHNLRQQVLDRCRTAGYVVNPASVRGIVRGQPGAAARRVEVWVQYQQHTVEHRRALTNAYDDGIRSERTAYAVVHDEHTPTGEDGAPLTGHAWAEYVATLSSSPYDAEPVTVTDPDDLDGTLEVLDTAWRRGWAESSAARVEGRNVHTSPYMRTVRP